MGHFLALPPQLVLADGQFGCRNAENFATEPVKETFWVDRRHSWPQNTRRWGSIWLFPWCCLLRTALSISDFSNKSHFSYSSEACRIQCIFDRQDSQEKYDWIYLKITFEVQLSKLLRSFQRFHLTHCWHSILNKYLEIDVEIFLVLVGLLTDYLPDYWLPFFILRRDFPLKSQTSSLVWGIEKWKWNRDAKKQKSFDLSVHVWALTIIHNVYYT